MRNSCLLIPRLLAKADMLWIFGGLFRENLLLDGWDEFTDRDTPRVFLTFALGIAAVQRKRSAPGKRIT